MVVRVAYPERVPIHLKLGILANAYIRFNVSAWTCLFLSFYYFFYCERWIRIERIRHFFDGRKRTGLKQNFPLRILRI